MTAASGPEVCACNGWATDLRVGYPNGHHRRCPEQPEPSRMVELVVSAELLVEGFFKLPGAMILNAKMATTPVLDPGIVKFVVEMSGAPDHAVSMDPVYTTRYWPDGRRRDYYLSAITWRLADGTSTRQTFEPSADEAIQLVESGIVSPSEVKPWSDGDAGSEVPA